jgi:spore germination cell wall hydrolase CwlJ-like protein
MQTSGVQAGLRAVLLLLTGSALCACTTAQQGSTLNAKSSSAKTAKLQHGPAKQVYTYTAKDRECLKRAMYFESERSSEKGFLAVGSVIMNRLTSGIYPQTICGVVTQKNQFAPGLMTRKFEEETAPDLDKAADAVLKGARHPDVKDAMFFHRKGLRFGYDNMHYVAAAGGNVFYEKRDQDGQLQTAEPKPVDQYILAYAANGTQQSSLASVMTTPEAAPAAPASTASATVMTASLPSADNAATKGEASSGAPLNVAPVISAAVVRAGMPSDFVETYDVPQNSQVPAHTYQASLSATVPIPAARPDEPDLSSQKRRGAGIAVASQPNPNGLTYQDWVMRTGNW